MTKELRNKNDEELLQLFVRLKGQLLQMRFLHANGELDKPHKIQQVRQLIARVLTILHERNVDATKINAVAGSTILDQTKVNSSSSIPKSETNHSSPSTATVTNHDKQAQKASTK